MYMTEQHPMLAEYGRALVEEHKRQKEIAEAERAFNREHGASPHWYHHHYYQDETCEFYNPIDDCPVWRSMGIKGVKGKVPVVHFWEQQALAAKVQATMFPTNYGMIRILTDPLHDPDTITIKKED